MHNTNVRYIYLISYQEKLCFCSILHRVKRVTFHCWLHTVTEQQNSFFHPFPLTINSDIRSHLMWLSHTIVSFTDIHSSILSCAAADMNHTIPCRLHKPSIFRPCYSRSRVSRSDACQNNRFLFIDCYVFY